MYFALHMWNLGRGENREADRETKGKRDGHRLSSRETKGQTETDAVGDRGRKGKEERLRETKY